MEKKKRAARPSKEKEKDDRDLICKVQDAFRVFARGSSNVLGTAWSFVTAILVIVIWAATGHIFHYSDTWQLIINTGTTIVTFLMVFLIQNTQNRDSKAVHLKLDELIRVIHGARNQLVDIERLSDQDLQKLQKQFESVGKKAAESSSRIDDLEDDVDEVAGRTGTRKTSR
ncbi:MAG: low affinity iron permease family protein [Verrucomicrobiota bacterium]|nr:low affinity iron permease family protein [Verrucomicrobiota bacterium]